MRERKNVGHVNWLTRGAVYQNGDSLSELLDSYAHLVDFKPHENSQNSHRPGLDQLGKRRQHPGAHFRG
jgi:hypothetical protein